MNTCKQGLHAITGEVLKDSWEDSHFLLKVLPQQTDIFDSKNSYIFF